LLAEFAPAGAQIALRLHIGRLRDTELANDVNMLLEALPDWRSLMDGSGLDPLRDIERLYIATPDLRRENVVIAGQYVGGDAVAERAVESLGRAHSVKARWRKRGAIRVAPWANSDETERVIALIAPEQFAIVRPDDLPRVLEVARALAQRRTVGVPATDAEAADALLGLAESETLSLSVEGARLFAKGNLRGVPERLLASVSQSDDGALDTHVIGNFESEEAAEQARAYWEEMRERYAGNALVALIGLRAPLTDATVTAAGDEVVVDTHVTLQQARVVLGFIRSALGPPPQPTVPQPNPVLPAQRPTPERIPPKGRARATPSGP
jgi:hypothetical protein